MRQRKDRKDTNVFVCSGRFTECAIFAIIFLMSLEQRVDIVMIVNYSNHPSSKWSERQICAAEELGKDIVDIPFPNVPPDMGSVELAAYSEEECKKIESYCPDAVMCQGEFCMSYAVITRLKAKGIKVVAACSERRVKENPRTGKKEVEFEFVRFREYV